MTKICQVDIQIRDLDRKRKQIEGIPCGAKLTYSV